METIRRLEADVAEKEAERHRREAEQAARRQQTGRGRDSVVDALLKSGARTLGREISRTIFGTRRR